MPVATDVCGFLAARANMKSGNIKYVILLFNVARRKEGRAGTRNHVTEREAPGRLTGQRSTDFAAIQLTINDRYDYIAVIRVKGDLLRAQKVQ